MKRRVVITGLGAITPLGTGADKFWNVFMQGENGFALITRFDILIVKQLVLRLRI